MKVRMQIPALALAVLLMFAARTTAYAHDVPDMSRTGTVSVRMMYDGNAVPGGELTLYQVGDIYEDDGNYSFVLAEAYVECGVSLEDLESDTLAGSLAEYTVEHQVQGSGKATVGSDGKAVIGNLKLGLYLVVQTKAAENYEAVAPFLVSVPMNEEGTYIYQVDATPKMSTLTKKPSEPLTPPGTKLPQTGQLNWPVPVLAALGLCLILLGCGLRAGKRGVPYEA